jgi:dTDP-4-dehydrorhamnose 3,5-epimerase
MDVTSLAIPEVKLLVPKRFRDERGFFSATFNVTQCSAAGIPGPFVQDNHSLSRAMGVVRGLHFQIAPKAQGKLVRVVRGAVFDVAVDIRRGSPTYGRHVSAVLSAENWAQLWIPAGFAHGFATIEPDVELLYKVDADYAPDLERGILWNDPDLGIEWPVEAALAQLSPRDETLPRFRDLPAYFTA